MDVLILDMTHGGDILSREMKGQGHNVTCADVYGIAPVELKAELYREGISICDIPEGRFDLVLNPVHCPDRFLENVEWSERKSFNQAVNELVKDEGFRIEVTGEKGKTGLCYFLAHMLHVAGKSVLLHTSRSREYWDEYGYHVYDGKYSIAPTSLLTLPDTDADITITEISLGGSGKSDISIITNLKNDYPIAACTRKASEGKSSILNPEGINIIVADELQFWSRFCPDLVCAGRFVDLDRGSPLDSPRPMTLTYAGEQHRVLLSPAYLHNSYEATFNLGLEVLSQMGIDTQTVIRGMESFKGVPGRGEIIRHGDAKIIIERNPGISADSILFTLESLSNCIDLSEVRIVIDPVNRKVCDKLDEGRIESVLSKMRLSATWVQGESLYALMDRYHDEDTVLLFIKEGYQ